MLRFRRVRRSPIQMQLPGRVKARPLDIEHGGYWREPGDVRDAGLAATAMEVEDDPRNDRIEQTGLVDHLGRTIVRYVIPLKERFGFALPVSGEPDELHCLTTVEEMRMRQTEAGDDSELGEFSDDDADS